MTEVRKMCDICNKTLPVSQCQHQLDENEEIMYYDEDLVYVRATALDFTCPYCKAAKDVPCTVRGVRMPDDVRTVVFDNKYDFWRRYPQFRGEYPYHAPRMEREFDALRTARLTAYKERERARESDVRRSGAQVRANH